MIKSFLKRAALMSHRAESTRAAAEGEPQCRSRCESTHSAAPPPRTGPRKVRSCANLVRAKTKTLVRAKSSTLLRARSPCPPPPLPPNPVYASSKIQLKIFPPADASVSGDARSDDRSLSPSRPNEGFLTRRICKRFPSLRILRPNPLSIGPRSAPEAEREQNELVPVNSPVRSLFGNTPWPPMGQPQSLRKRLLQRKPIDLDDSESDTAPTHTAEADEHEEETEEDEYSFYSAVMVPLEFPDEENPSVNLARRAPIARPGWDRQPEEQEQAKRGSGLVWFGINY